MIHRQHLHHNPILADFRLARALTTLKNAKKESLGVNLDSERYKPNAGLPHRAQFEDYAAGWP